MESRAEFQKRVRAALDDIGESALSYNESEFWMIQSPYEYVEFYAVQNRLWNTAIALPLTRGLHSGAHRKFSMMKEGVAFRVPYLIHPLLVCRMLIDLQPPISKEEEDILLASAMCHDLIEDVLMPEHAQEMMTRFHLDRGVYETVCRVTKRKDFTEEEEREHFRRIQEHKLALLVKLSDRGNNVEDLYNMSGKKVHEYVDETKRLILPMCAYSEEHYPDIQGAVEILRDKLIVLTEAASILVDRYDLREKEMRQQVKELQEENTRLREIWKQLWTN